MENKSHEDNKGNGKKGKSKKKKTPAHRVGKGKARLVYLTALLCITLIPTPPDLLDIYAIAITILIFLIGSIMIRDPEFDTLLAMVSIIVALMITYISKIVAFLFIPLIALMFIDRRYTRWVIAKLTRNDIFVVFVILWLFLGGSFMLDWKNTVTVVAILIMPLIVLLLAFVPQILRDKKEKLKYLVPFSVIFILMLGISSGVYWLINYLRGEGGAGLILAGISIIIMIKSYISFSYIKEEIIEIDEGMIFPHEQEQDKSPFIYTLFVIILVYSINAVVCHYPPYVTTSIAYVLGSMTLNFSEK